MKTTKKAKIRTAVLIIISLFLIIFSLTSTIFIFIQYFFPNLLHSERYRGVVYYESNSYEQFGIGMNRYGKLASNYLPNYSEISKEATYIDFYYNDSSSFMLHFVSVCVGVRYEKDTYNSKIYEIKQVGEGLGDHTATETKSILLSQEKRLNGEIIYYIAEYSDMDCAIMYWVVIIGKDCYDGNPSFSCLLDDTRMVYTEFWQDLHPIANEKWRSWTKT